MVSLVIVASSDVSAWVISTRCACRTHLVYARGTAPWLLLTGVLRSSAGTSRVFCQLSHTRGSKKTNATRCWLTFEAELEAGRAAVKIRYEKAAEGEGVDIKKLAAEQTKELEELEASVETKRPKLGSLVRGALINETDYRNLPEEYEELVTVGMGGEALAAMLRDTDQRPDPRADRTKPKAPKASARKDCQAPQGV